MTLKPGQVLRTLKVDNRKVVIRCLSENDAESATDYINSLVDEKAYITRQKKVNLDEERDWVESAIKQIKNSRSVNLVFEVDGKFAGAFSSTKKFGEAVEHVCEFGIGIYKDYRKLGLGKLAMNTLIELSKTELKCKVAKLDVYEKNVIAINLYKKMGFREVGRISNGVNFMENLVTT